jgi:hypothetical protein
MPPPPMIRDWARELITFEIDADSLQAQSELATLRVYEKLRRNLCAPVGVDAFHALASRALYLAKSQFPSLSAANVAENGGLNGLGKCEDPINAENDSEVGITLIAQMLRLFVTLVGEAAMFRLLEDAVVPVATNSKSDATEESKSAPGTNYLGPFKDISLEADQLRLVSERLETLTDVYHGIDELMSVAGNIRSIANALDVFTLIRGKAGWPARSFEPDCLLV